MLLTAIGNGAVIAYGLTVVLLGALAAAVLHARTLRRKSLFSRHEALLAQLRLEAVLGAVPRTAFIIDAEQRVVGRIPASASNLLGRDGVAGTRLSNLLSGNVTEDRRLQTVAYLEAMLRAEPADNPLADVELHGRHVRFTFEKIDSHGMLAGILVTLAERTAAARAAPVAPIDDAPEAATTGAAEEATAVAAPAAEPAPPQDLLAITQRLQRDGTALAGFLQDASSKTAQVRAMLRMPARAEQAFREKLNRIQELIAALRTRAAELSLLTVVQQASDFEQLLLGLHDKPTLTGNDFLPLAVKLDDLFSHIALMGETLGHSVPSPAAAANDDESSDDYVATQLLPGPQAAVSEDLGAFVRRLASDIAAERGREVSVVSVGLEDVPDNLYAELQEILAHLVRNSVLHGLESPAEREQHGKPRAGTFVVQFDIDERGAFNLSFQDDGRGLNYARIRAVAIEQGILTAAVADRIDQRKLASLIFRPGFSTAANGPEHVGAIGMDLVRERVHTLGGKVGVATKPGEFTRFRIMLPRALRRKVA
ncbi:MAG: ATP-binding protein [Steroidobacteraceae bacterium]|nr:ATP-binding protein [Steroidobacteraceae bacterium]